MKKLISIGEALIDFIPQEVGVSIAKCDGFTPMVGGAPLNVAGAYAKHGGKAELITQIGRDDFGDKIISELKVHGIGTEYVLRTNKANTALAFVALKEDGNREFSFYRNPSADLLLSSEQIEKHWFDDIFALHFCSVSLISMPMKEAHKVAIEYAREAGGLVSFDPNLRFSLWEDVNLLKETVWEFIPSADILKISDEELEFLTEEKNEESAISKLFIGDVKMVICTKGKDGATVYTKTKIIDWCGEIVNVIDTTGAGDAFIGSFLANLAKTNQSVECILNLSYEDLQSVLKNAVEYAGRTTEKNGALMSYHIVE